MQANASCAGLRTASSRSTDLPENSSRSWMRRNAHSAPEADSSWLKKLRGRLVASPVGFCLEVSYFFFFFAFFLAAMVLFSLLLFMENCNVRLLHPSFVEPLKSEVKKKISVCCS